VDVKNRWGVEGATGQAGPVGGRKAAKGDEDKYARHPHVKARAVIGTDGSAVNENSFHRQTPEILFSGGILRLDETFGQFDVAGATLSNSLTSARRARVAA